MKFKGGPRVLEDDANLLVVVMRLWLGSVCSEDQNARAFPSEKNYKNDDDQL